MHRDLYVHVGMLEGIVGEAGLFGAENHGDGLVERQSVRGVIVLMRAGGNDLITLAVQIVERLRGVELVDVVFMQVEPLAGTHDDVRIYVVNPFVFNDVHVLYACEVAAAQHSTGIV